MANELDSIQIGSVKYMLRDASAERKRKNPLPVVGRIPRATSIGTRYFTRGVCSNGTYRVFIPKSLVEKAVNEGREKVRLYINDVVCSSTDINLSGVFGSNHNRVDRSKSSYSKLKTIHNNHITDPTYSGIILLFYNTEFQTAFITVEKILIGTTYLNIRISMTNASHYQGNTTSPYLLLDHGNIIPVKPVVDAGYRSLYKKISFCKRRVVNQQFENFRSKITHRYKHVSVYDRIKRASTQAAKLKAKKLFGLYKVCNTIRKRWKSTITSEVHYYNQEI